jgi:hypothetical protein
VPQSEAVRDKNFILRVKRDDDFSTYWWGHQDGDVYAPRPSPDRFKIEGNYTAAHRRRAISKSVSIIGKIPINSQ